MTFSEAYERLFAKGVIDYRHRMPRHPTKRYQRRVYATDILGDCTHHTAGKNQDPVRTAQYDIAPGNHVSATGCPGFTYTFAISSVVGLGQALLCNDLENITWAQGREQVGNREDWSGDENRHLLSIVVMGDFDGPGHKGYHGMPHPEQILAWFALTKDLREIFGYGPHAHFGHYHFGKAQCPGHYLSEAIEKGHKDEKPWTDKQWQEALLRWRPDCLPRFGADGQWGDESRRALIAFERERKHRADGLRDPFTQLLLERR